MPSKSEQGFSGPTAWAQNTGQKPAPIEAGDSNSASLAIDRAFGWLRRHQLPVLAAAVLFQAGVLLSLSYQGARPIYAAQARTVLLKVNPIDPRDLMRGDYVTLGYDFNRLNRSQLPVEPNLPMYAPLVLEADGRHARGQGLQSEAPPFGTLFLRGTSEGNGLVRFGIEKFFVPEGEGKSYEAAVLRHQLWAEVTIAPDGEARLHRLVIE